MFHLEGARNPIERNAGLASSHAAEQIVERRSAAGTAPVCIKLNNPTNPSGIIEALERAYEIGKWPGILTNCPVTGPVLNASDWP